MFYMEKVGVINYFRIRAITCENRYFRFHSNPIVVVTFVLSKVIKFKIGLYNMYGTPKVHGANVLHVQFMFKCYLLYMNISKRNR